MTRYPRTSILIASIVAAVATTAGQEPLPAGRSGLGIDVSAEIDGPAPPVAPAVISRDAAGRVTGRAVRVPTPLQMDGHLDESIYTTVPPMTGFIQNDPVEGAPASERTEVWVLFDNDHVYLSARCWESNPDRMIVNEMRRDNTAIAQDDNLAWAFDTFYDRRNATLFEVNALGGRIDAQTSNEGQTNFDWNPIWQVEVRRFDGGWTMETAMPFKSLRYRPGPDQIWGFNLRRRNRWKNELSYLRPVPAALGARGLRPALMAPLVGIEAPPGSKNLEIKPFAISDFTTDTAETSPVHTALGGDIGIDVKYGLTNHLTADFTYNTDFAQVEADEQQVNLTRFNLFFPEKREFFLENRRTFDFGGQGGSTPILFHSRRIGLQNSREVPVRGGGRLTGRIGSFDLGVVHIRTEDESIADARATGFSVVRVKRDILRSSSVGVLFTGRSVNLAGTGSNATYGIDGGFSFLENQLVVDTYWAQTQTTGLTGDESSYRANVEYDGDRYGFGAERLAIGDAFNPEVGFVRRRDMTRSLGQFRFSPRLLSVDAIRKLSWSGQIDYIENRRGQVETREEYAEFGIEFENSDRLTFRYVRNFEFLTDPFEISPGVILPVDGYDFESIRSSLTLGAQRVASAQIQVEHGSFFSGHKTSVDVTRGRVKLTPGFSAEPTYSVNWVDLAEGAFTTQLIGSRVTYTMTPLMFTSALVQYNSSRSTVSTNIRFRWEYQPGSELFVVYDDERGDTLDSRFEGFETRAFIVKITRLFRF